jgi:ribosomal protein S18 acetylase RimI-like enzyme
VLVRPLGDDDRSWKDEALCRVWGSTSVARLGALVDAAELPGFVALAGESRVGLLTFARVGDDIEVVTVQTDRESAGIGQALMDAVLTHARTTQGRRLWLVTTNDNVRAIGFYRRWGLELVDTINDGVAASRRVKPSIPLVAPDGIAVRDELIFARRLHPHAPPAATG